MTHAFRGLALLLCVTAPCSLAAQVEKPPGAGQGEQKQKPAWPKISRKDKATGEKWLKLLRSKKDDVKFKAVDQLVILGLPFADRLFRSLKDSKHGNANTEICMVLDQVLAAEHAPLIALHAKHKSTFARRFVQKTLAKFGSKDSIPVFEQAQKDKDVEVRYYAALGLVKTRKDLAGLQTVYDRCIDQWEELGDEIHRLLVTTKSETFNSWFAKRLQAEDPMERVTALRLMRTLSPRTSASMLRSLLDAEDAIVKKETINTLRVMHGEKPLPLTKITAFRIINLAKAWKKRIG